MIEQPGARFPEPLRAIPPKPVETFLTPSRIVDGGNTLLPESSVFASRRQPVSWIVQAGRSPDRISLRRQTPCQAPRGPEHDLDQSEWPFREQSRPLPNSVS